MPTIVNNNVAGIHPKVWQMMAPAPVASAAGSFVIAGDATNLSNETLYMQATNVHYLYHYDEDAWVQVPAGALTVGAGACGARSRWSATLTANGGTTTTITTAASISGNIKDGCTVRMLSGTRINEERTVVGAPVINPGGTSTITVTPAFSGAILNGETFAVDCGSFFVVASGVQSASTFKRFDMATLTWGAGLSVTGFIGTTATDARMVSTQGMETIASFTATAGAGSTVTKGSAAWTTNQWTNYQVRITGGLGVGQVRTIASNTGTVITVSSAWTVNPDATSVCAIQGNDDFLYVTGNGTTALYRYSISGNTWTTLAVRPGAASTGVTANWVDHCEDAGWSVENDIKDGRYIFSMRGGASTALDRYDIALNTWAAITYGSTGETFTTGSSSASNGRYMYLRKDATNRFFKYSARGNLLEPLSTNLYPDGAALLGNKMWLRRHDDTSGVAYLYSLQNTGAVLQRLQVF